MFDLASINVGQFLVCSNDGVEVLVHHVLQAEICDVSQCCADICFKEFLLKLNCKSSNLLSNCWIPFFLLFFHFFVCGSLVASFLGVLTFLYAARSEGKVS